jgi:hypothetical protein
MFCSRYDITQGRLPETGMAALGDNASFLRIPPAKEIPLNY